MLVDPFYNLLQVYNLKAKWGKGGWFFFQKYDNDSYQNQDLQKIQTKFNFRQAKVRKNIICSVFQSLDIFVQSILIWEVLGCQGKNFESKEKNFSQG